VRCCLILAETACGWGLRRSRRALSFAQRMTLSRSSDDALPPTLLCVCARTPITVAAGGCCGAI
jgi:hypothetical protein